MAIFHVFQKYEKDFLFTIRIPYYGKTSNHFAKRLANLIKLKFNIHINVYFTTMKTASCFPLKCTTPFALLSNVVYKFTCLCDANNTYIGMTTRYIDTIVKEHLHSKTQNRQFAIMLRIAKHAWKQNTT